MSTPVSTPSLHALGKKVRVLIADDHALVRQGIIMLVKAQDDMEVIGDAANGEEAFRLARALRPDVVVMDVSMPIVNGALATERLRAVCPDVRVLALSAYQDDAHINQLMESGAVGYVFKMAVADELTGAIRQVAAGGTYLDPSVEAGQQADRSARDNGGMPLSNRESQVLRLAALGNTNREIAAELHLSVKTVEGHKSRLMEKLHLSSRAQLVNYAMERGWLGQI